MYFFSVKLPCLVSRVVQDVLMRPSDDEHSHIGLNTLKQPVQDIRDQEQEAQPRVKGSRLYE